MPLPDVLDTVDVLDEGSSGPLFWYVVLAERLGQTRALEAMDGWAGDSYVTFEDEKALVCVRAAFVADDGAAMRTMADAFTAWASAMPKGAAVVNPTDDELRVQACDPGMAGTRPAAPDAVADRLLLPATRSWIMLSLLRDGSTPERATCASVEVARRVPVAAFAEEVDDAFLAVLHEVVASCPG